MLPFLSSFCRRRAFGKRAVNQEYLVVLIKKISSFSHLLAIGDDADNRQVHFPP